MSLAKKFSSVFLSVALVIGLMPCAAYAEQPADAKDDVAQSAVAQELNSENIDAQGDDGDVAAYGDDEDFAVEADDSASEGEGTDVVYWGDDDVAENSAKAEGQDTTDSVAGQVADTSAFEFIYVDQKSVAIGETQSIAVSFVNPQSAAGSVLYYQKQDGEVQSVEASKAADGAALFEIPFNNAAACGTYNLVKVSWTTPVAGEAAVSNDTDTGYSFVVEEELASESGEAVSAYALDDSGNLSEESNLADTIADISRDDEAIAQAEENDGAAAVNDSGEANEDDSDDGIALLSADSRSSKKMVIALDAGHGGSDSGATNGNLIEKNLNLSIARYCRDELKKYNGVTVYMVRDSDEYVDLKERVDRAVNAGADVFVSIHINETPGATGFEVWVQNDSSWRYYLHQESSELGNSILSKLSALGLKNRGNKESDSSTTKYADGSKADYLSVLRNSRYNDLPAVLIEHGFIDGASADQSLLSSESGLKRMGIADAQGIASKYGLTQGTPSWAKIAGEAHVSNLGWMTASYDGETIGTTGESRPLEALKLSLVNGYQKQGGIQTRAHVANIGWQGWTTGTAGTTGRSLAMEAVQIKLTGELANKYDVWYRVHSADYGWLGWAKNGASAGTEGYGKAAQAVQVKLVAKGGSAPGSTSNAFKNKADEPTTVVYQAHVANIGWQSSVSSGATAGTTGRSLAMEALRVSIDNAKVSGGIQTRAHVANIGWQGWTTGTAGTTGRSLAMEAVQIKLTGELANKYDVWYRVHSADYGWLGWAKNGASAGTEGYGKAAQAVQVKLVAKGGSAPGSTSNAFKNKADDVTPIMGSSSKTVDQMVACYEKTGHKYPASTYASKGAPTLRDFCQIAYEEAKAEGVRAEVLFAQAMWETGWLQFGGDVKASQCNFGGLGATGGGAQGATFANVRTGLRAQVQHLKAYASTASLKNTCVDPRFSYVTRGCAPNLEDLNGKWAVPGDNYGQNIRAIINRM